MSNAVKIFGIVKLMKEFDYDLDYKQLDFTDEETQNFIVLEGEKLRSSTGSPYTDDICAHWRFRTADIAVKSSNKIYNVS